MGKIDLVTVTFQHVVSVEIPAFNPMPDCLVWGQRFFFKRAGMNCYVEGFTFIIPVVAAGALT